MPDDATFTIADLARLSGLNVRTIRYYLAQGLIPASGESGPGAHYGQGHLDRLRLTKRLQGQHLPLAEIRARLEHLSDADVAALVATTDAQPETPQTSALDYIRSVLGTGSVRPAPAPAPVGQPPRAFVAEPRAPYAASVAPVPGHVAPKAERPGGGGMEALRLRMPMPRARDLPSEPTAGAATEARLGAGTADTPPEDRRTEAPNPERSQWERLSLGPNIELHVRRPLSRIEQRRVERLITIARQVLRDDRA